MSLKLKTFVDQRALPRKGKYNLQDNPVKKWTKDLNRLISKGDI